MRALLITSRGGLLFGEDDFFYGANGKTSDGFDVILIALNDNKGGRLSDIELAANLLHELGALLGKSHEQNKQAEKEFIQWAFDELKAELLEHEKNLPSNPTSAQQWEFVQQAKPRIEAWRDKYLALLQSGLMDMIELPTADEEYHRNRLVLEFNRLVIYAMSGSQTVKHAIMITINKSALQ